MRRTDWLVRALPASMTEDDFFVRFIGIFQSVADTVLHQIDTLPDAFDPTVAPTPMVREMGRWLGIDWMDDERDPMLQRGIVRTYASLLRERGTKRGLVRLLELITGAGGVTVTDTGGVHRLHDAAQHRPHVSVSITTSGWARPEDVVRILRDELPATVTFDLRIGDDLVWPPRRAAATTAAHDTAAVR